MSTQTETQVHSSYQLYLDMQKKGLVLDSIHSNTIKQSSV